MFVSIFAFFLASISSSQFNSDFDSTVMNLKKCTCKIHAYSSHHHEHASFEGVIVHSAGYILTSDQYLDGVESCTVQWISPDLSEYVLSANVIDIHDTYRAALIKIEDRTVSAYPYLKVANIPPEKGEAIVTVSSSPRPNPSIGEVIRNGSIEGELVAILGKNTRPGSGYANSKSEIVGIHTHHLDRCSYLTNAAVLYEWINNLIEEND